MLLTPPEEPFERGVELDGRDGIEGEDVEGAVEKEMA